MSIFRSLEACFLGRDNEPHTLVMKRTYQPAMLISLAVVVTIACASALYLSSLGPTTRQSPGGSDLEYQFRIEPKDEGIIAPKSSRGSPPLPAKYLNHDGLVSGYRIVSDRVHIIEVADMKTDPLAYDLTPSIDPVISNPNWSGKSAGISRGAGSGSDDEIYISPEFEVTELDAPPRELAKQGLRILSEIKDPKYPDAIKSDQSLCCETIVFVFVDEDGKLGRFPDTLRGRATASFHNHGKMNRLELLYEGRDSLIAIMDMDGQLIPLPLNGPKIMEYQNGDKIDTLEYAQFTRWIVDSDQDSIYIENLGTGVASGLFANEMIRPLLETDFIPRIENGRPVGSWFASMFLFNRKTGSEMDWLRQLHLNKLKRKR